MSDPERSNREPVAESQLRRRKEPFDSDAAAEVIKTKRQASRIAPANDFDSNELLNALGSLDLDPEILPSTPSRSTTTKNKGDAPGSGRLSGSNMSPLIPLSLALLPGCFSVLVGEGAGQFATDVLLLFAMGWILWSVSEGAWKSYVNSLLGNHHSMPEYGSAPALEGEQLTTLASLLLYLLTPFMGGVMLHFARANLSRGSGLVSNFNIFLYVSFEFARVVNRISSLRPLGDLSVLQDQIGVEALKKTQQRLQSLESEIERLASHMSLISKKVVDNDSSVQTDVRALKKGVDKVALSVRKIQARGLSSSSNWSPDAGSEPEPREPREPRESKGRKLRRSKLVSPLEPVSELHENDSNVLGSETRHPTPPALDRLRNLKSSNQPNGSEYDKVNDDKDRGRDSNTPYMRQRLLWPVIAVWNFAVYAAVFLPAGLMYRIVRLSRKLQRSR